MGKAARERQVIATWYEPKKKLPPTDQYVVITYSGEAGSRRFVNALGLGAYYPGQPERIKGHWIEITSSNHTYKCSVCGRLLANIADGKNNVAKNYPYCHCGADMRGEQDG